MLYVAEYYYPVADVNDIRQSKCFIAEPLLRIDLVWYLRSKETAHTSKMRVLPWQQKEILKLTPQHP